VIAQAAQLGATWPRGGWPGRLATVAAFWGWLGDREREHISCENAGNVVTYHPVVTFTKRDSQR
jgi:hypothetical protein